MVYKGTMHLSSPLSSIYIVSRTLWKFFEDIPSRPTDLECTETLLAGINSRSYIYIWHKYYGTATNKPTGANLKTKIKSLNKDIEASNVFTVSSTCCNL